MRSRSVHIRVLGSEYQPERASTANYKFAPTRKKSFAAFLVFLVDDVKKALPRSDEEYHLTHQTKEELCPARLPLFS